ncbi:MAG: LysR substrate-binding domain-containing protein [Pseudomonadota bacterium]
MADWIPSLYALRAFEVVSRHLSYKTAAEELKVTPAAVKQLVVKLEAAVSTKLIGRVGHRLELTPSGLAGQTDLELAMLHMSEAVKKMRHPRRDTRLIVTVEASLATTWLVPRLEKFRAARPGIDVLIDSSQRVVDMKREDVDIAIRYGVPSEDGLVINRLFEDLVLPACSPGMRSGPQRFEHLDDLRDAPLIHWDLSQTPWAQKTRQWFDWGSWFAQRKIHGVDTSKGLRFNDYGLAVQAAVSGQGVLLAGWPALQDTIEAGLLICPFPEHVQRTDIGFDVVTTEDAASRPEVAAFIDWLTGIAGESPSGRLLVSERSS